MKNILAAAAAVIALSACVTSEEPPLPTPTGVPTSLQPTYLTINSQFDAGEVAWARVPGNNTIKASAVLRQAGGGVITCAGFEAHMFPVSTYSTERVTALYGSSTKGMWRAPYETQAQLPPAPFEYEELGQTEACDPQGYVTFSNLADGAYFVLMQVTWQVPTGNQYFNRMDEQGGWLMQRVVVKGGEERTIVLTQSSQVEPPR